MRAMKNMAIVCNIGHFDSGSDWRPQQMKWTEISRTVARWNSRDGKKLIICERAAWLTSAPPPATLAS